MMFAIIGKLVVGLLLAGSAIIGGNAINSRIAERRAQRGFDEESRFAVLHEADGDAIGGVVVWLRLAPLLQQDGSLPEVITWKGKVYRHDPWSGVGRDWIEETQCRVTK